MMIVDAYLSYLLILVPIEFILPEFVSYLGARGVLCVGNGSHFSPYEHVQYNVSGP